MDLPSEFETFREYFFSALLFLKRFQWVYNYPNIELLSQDIFRQIPTDFKKDFKNSIQERINDVILNTFMGNGTYDFTLGIRRLRLDPKLEEAQICSYEFPHNSSLSEKKRLEILYFAPAIHQFCVKNNIKYIIDVGCGLGYLTHLLNELYGYSVLGIDCNGKFIQAAYKNQEKLHPKSIGAVKFEEHFINDESAGEIEEMIQKHFPNLGNGKVAIVGLHACADLSVTIFELFNRLKSVKSLVIMPCCYHRLELEKEHDGCEYFQNFPLSNALQDIFFQLEGQHFLRRPFLRLACQQSRATFMPLSREDRRKQAQNWFFRAILELAACKESCKVKRLTRKSGNTNIQPDSTDIDDFLLYISNLHNTHELVPLASTSTSEIPKINSEDFQEKLRRYWLEYKDEFYLVEMLCALQVAIQDICENIILLDRVKFMKEQGINCYIRRVIIDTITPRCYAIFAEKYT